MNPSARDRSPPETPTVVLLVEHPGGGDETWVKENGVVVYPQIPADRPEA